jgi:hypothetical protein
VHTDVNLNYEDTGNTIENHNQYYKINFPSGFQPMRLAFDSSNNMYMSGGTTVVTNPSKSVYKINLDSLVATLYITISDIGSAGIIGIAIDSRNYLYSIGLFDGSIKSQLYRTTPDGITTELVYTFPDGGAVSFDSINYIPWEDALLMVDAVNNKLYKVFLSYIFMAAIFGGRLAPHHFILLVPLVYMGIGLSLAQFLSVKFPKNFLQSLR